MRTILVCGMALCLAACGRKNQASEPAIDLPPRTTDVAVDPAGPDSITITLTADGRILARGRAWSLAGLERLLGEAMHRDGTAFYATTVVRLRVDRAAPWIHLRWVAHTVASCFGHELRLVFRDATLGEVDVRCTVSSLLGDLFDPDWVRVVRMRVVVDEGNRIRCGERTAEARAAVGAWAAEAAARRRKEDLADFRSEIVPRDGSAWGTIAAVYEGLRAAGAHVSFAGGYLEPGPTVVELDRLPQPDAETARRAADMSSDGGGVAVGWEWTLVEPELGPEWRKPEEEAPLEEPEPEIPEDHDTGK